ncbi:MAG TPA: ABC transporter substrate-binding protein [Chloroflexota bacterium]|nr:ABC transporter substrate-binding protein [Chloroflexota bacterium]
MLLAACGGTAAPAASSAAAQQSGAAAKPSGPLQQLIDGAAKEGQLNLVWGAGSLGDSIDPFAAGFNKAYGLNVKFQFTPGPQMRDQAAKTIQEVQTGRPPSSDLFLGYGDTLAVMADNKALEQVDWSWAPNLKNADQIAPNGVGVVVQDGLDGITYNTNKLKGDQVPKTLQDLLKPEFKGHLASTPYAAGFDYLASDEMWGEQKLFDFLPKFSAQLSGLLRCSEMDRIGNGEFDAFALDCSQGETLRRKSQGAPVDLVVPSDAAFTTLLYLGVTKGTPHPNAAKLFVNYMSSREAQDILYKTGFADTHFVAGSKTAKLIYDVKASGAKVTDINLQWVEAQGDKEAARLKRAVDILNSGAKK